MTTDTFSFSLNGNRYSGLVDVPNRKEVRALIVLVPGSGRTNIVANNGFFNARSRFAEQGFACLVWDKAGCGRSEGVFDGDQTVQSSADEVVAAIAEAKSIKLPGSEKVGLWGISRAGWICPLVIHKCPISFWISVSGTDDKETFGYLLQRNFMIEGRSKSQARALVREWERGSSIFRKGGSFEAYQKATRNLRADSFWIAINGDSETKDRYQRNQKNFIKEQYQFDKATGLRIYVPGFDKILRDIDCPVLAIFGEKDSQVDWQRTMALYRRTIGTMPKASLTVHVFPDCNHVMMKCRTGGYREELVDRQVCDGYYDTILGWLKDKGL